ncbi:MAG: hypothetical protein IH618_16635 [Ignavibacteriaceae bacterium]|nr:hypothetical protein [Ignavibacteriaceae bacterium]
MNVVILKPAYNSIKQPRLKFAERIIFINDKPEMELIIFGNKNGYDFLINTFNDFISEAREILEDHLHLDDQTNKEIVKRSISPNIRGAFKKWDEKKLKSYRYFIYDNKKKYLPYDLNEYKLVEPYTEIDARDNVYLTLTKK